MQTEYALAIPAKTIVIRVAGLPMEVMERLRLQRTTELIVGLLEREQQLRVQAEQLSEALYQVIGAVEEKHIRGSLIALRRSIYQLQL
ncbi:MAG TPA: hypothetical protein VFU49_23895, partial [Ktedonobacteraceae bacterium]|nr:hypothetical protein [Ktedonobacteraceae bacterium]